MIYTHDHYELLTALAATGQLSRSELSDLEAHRNDCAACRKGLAELQEVSLELFLTHAKSVSRSALPGGMQQRFQERARRAGVPLTRPVPGALDRRMLRLALVPLLITIGATLSWNRMAKSGVPERTASQPDNPAQKTASLQPAQVLSAHLPQKRHPRTRGSFSLRGPVISETSSLSRHAPARTFSGATALAPMTINQDYQTSGLHLPRPKLFELVAVPDIWEAVDRDRPGRRTFHYNPSVASLSFLDGPQASGAIANPTLDFSRSQFHLNINKTW